MSDVAIAKNISYSASNLSAYLTALNKYITVMRFVYGGVNSQPEVRQSEVDYLHQYEN